MTSPIRRSFFSTAVLTMGAVAPGKAPTPLLMAQAATGAAPAAGAVTPAPAAAPAPDTTAAAAVTASRVAVPVYPEFTIPVEPVPSDAPARLKTKLDLIHLAERLTEAVGEKKAQEVLQKVGYSEDPDEWDYASLLCEITLELPGMLGADEARKLVRGLEFELWQEVLTERLGTPERTAQLLKEVKFEGDPVEQDILSLLPEMKKKLIDETLPFKYSEQQAQANLKPPPVNKLEKKLAEKLGEKKAKEILTRIAFKGRLENRELRTLIEAIEKEIIPYLGMLRAEGIFPLLWFEREEGFGIKVVKGDIDSFDFVTQGIGPQNPLFINPELMEGQFASLQTIDYTYLLAADGTVVQTRGLKIRDNALAGFGGGADGGLQVDPDIDPAKPRKLDDRKGLRLRTVALNPNHKSVILTPHAIEALEPELILFRLTFKKTPNAQGFLELDDIIYGLRTKRVRKFMGMNIGSGVAYDTSYYSPLTKAIVHADVEIAGIKLVKGLEPDGLFNLGHLSLEPILNPHELERRLLREGRRLTNAVTSVASATNTPARPLATTNAATTTNIVSRAGAGTNQTASASATNETHAPSINSIFGETKRLDPKLIKDFPPKPVSPEIVKSAIKSLREVIWRYLKTGITTSKFDIIDLDKIDEQKGFRGTGRLGVWSQVKFNRANGEQIRKALPNVESFYPNLTNFSYLVTEPIPERQKKGLSQIVARELAFNLLIQVPPKVDTTNGVVKAEGPAEPIHLTVTITPILRTNEQKKVEMVRPALSLDGLIYAGTSNEEGVDGLSAVIRNGTVKTGPISITADSIPFSLSLTNGLESTIGRFMVGHGLGVYADYIAEGVRVPDHLLPLKDGSPDYKHGHIDFDAQDVKTEIGDLRFNWRINEKMSLEGMPQGIYSHLNELQLRAGKLFTPKTEACGETVIENIIHNALKQISFRDLLEGLRYDDAEGSIKEGHARMVEPGKGETVADFERDTLRYNFKGYFPEKR